jgi:hypothetical protein
LCSGLFFSQSLRPTEGPLRSLPFQQEKFLKGCTHKAAHVSRIHAYVEDLEGQEA